MTADAPPAKRRRRRWRWWHIYLLLLAASFTTQFFYPALPKPRPGDLVVQVPRFNDDGPVAGEPVRICYRRQQPRTGDAPTLILLHGSPGSSGNFRRLMPRLAKDLDVIAPDLPGFGRSTRYVPDYSLRAHARYVLALMDELDIERAAVLGYSMGSGVALNMVDLAPDRVDSLIFYGGIGIQEGEGSGDYYVEHLKYAVGYALLVVAPEFVPHFGLLGSRSFRHATLRNFWDSDQRPLRPILESLDKPLLILHGKNDPLVPAWTARQHHEIVEDSELVMFDRSHFMVFYDRGADELAAEIIPFVLHHKLPDVQPVRRTVDPYANEPKPESKLPFGMDLRRGMSPWAQMGAIVVGTYVLEDPTTIFTGMMIRAGQVDLFVGVFALFIGIFTGDLALYLLGWSMGRSAFRWNFIQKRLPVHRVEQLGGWFDRHGWSAVITSRFVPGTRMPLYVAAGAMGKRPWRFALWTFTAVLIWAPVMVLMVVLLGDAAASPFKLIFGEHWLSLVFAIIVLLILLRLLMLVTTRIGRYRLLAGFARLWQWEFWPLWLFYIPVYIWIVALALRYRSATVWTLADPCIPDGGVVGESKAQILAQVEDERILPFAVIEPGEPDQRLAAACSAIAEHGWSYPLICKPDAAQRGAGVKLVRDEEQLADYLTQAPDAAMIQVYADLPYEAGIFYVRRLREPAGRIFSITDKHFSYITGDGRSTLEMLIWRHPRYRMQARTFLKRLGADRDRIPAAGEQVRLAVAGNHCQGTQFRDGTHLVTPELEREIDRFAKKFNGYYFGRIDVRYSDVEAFEEGRDMKIIEVNGVTSESTNVYDPSWSIFRAWGVLIRQWTIAYAIGDEVRRRDNVKPIPLRRLLRDVWRYYRARKVSLVSD